MDIAGKVLCVLVLTLLEVVGGIMGVAAVRRPVRLDGYLFVAVLFDGAFENVLEVGGLLGE